MITYNELASSPSEMITACLGNFIVFAFVAKVAMASSGTLARKEMFFRLEKTSCCMVEPNESEM